MKPLQLPECDTVFGANQKGVIPLPVCSNKDGSVTHFWRLSEDEVEEVCTTQTLAIRQYVNPDKSNFNPILPHVMSLEIEGDPYNEEAIRLGLSKGVVKFCYLTKDGAVRYAMGTLDSDLIRRMTIESNYSHMSSLVGKLIAQHANDLDLDGLVDSLREAKDSLDHPVFKEPRINPGWVTYYDFDRLGFRKFYSDRFICFL